MNKRFTFILDEWKNGISTSLANLFIVFLLVCLGIAIRGKNTLLESFMSLVLFVLLALDFGLVILILKLINSLRNKK